MAGLVRATWLGCWAVFLGIGGDVAASFDGDVAGFSSADMAVLLGGGAVARFGNSQAVRS